MKAESAENSGGWWRNPRLIDAALAVAVVVAVGLAMSASHDDRGRPADVFSYGFALAFGSLMFIRRQRPVTTMLLTTGILIGYYVLSYPPIGLAVPVAAALYSGAENGRLRWAVAIAFFLLVISSYARVQEGDDVNQLFGYDLPSTIAMIAAVIALGEGVRARRELRRQNEVQLAMARAEEAAEAVRLVEAERLRIARDLHDVLAHSLSVITIASGVGLEAIRDDSDASEQALSLIRRTSKESLTELRATLGLLRGDRGEVLSPTGSLHQLEQLVASMSESSVAVTVVRNGEIPLLPAVVDTAAFRVIQEALTNVVRHSRATSAEVQIERTAGSLSILVRDNGRPIVGDQVRTEAGFGLRGMRERIDLLGGSLSAELGLDGFEVRVQLPLKPVSGPAAGAASGARVESGSNR